MARHALVVVANPNTKSFSHAMALAATAVLQERRYAVSRHDLYAEKFDPVQASPEADNRSSASALVELHCRELQEAELIVVCHPDWWGQPPAILKGWIDRVFRPGVAYDYRAGASADSPAIGLLQGKTALVLNTSNTPWEREVAVFGNPLENLWKNCVFGLCGVTTFERRVFGPMASSTPELRQAWLDEVRALTESLA